MNAIAMIHRCAIGQGTALAWDTWAELPASRPDEAWQEESLAVDPRWREVAHHIRIDAPESMSLSQDITAEMEQPRTCRTRLPALRCSCGAYEIKVDVI